VTASDDKDARPTTPSIPVPSMGSIGYAAAREHVWDKQPRPRRDGAHPLLYCTWEELTDVERGAFEAAARAVGG
jgi:hypothetical protein